MTGKTPNALGRDAQQHEAVPAMHRLGDPSELEEYFDGDSHVLSWQITDIDKKLASTAGWDMFPLTVDGSQAVLSIPYETRNASSVLGGVEAWPGEKRSVIEKLCTFVAKTKEEFGQVDVSTSINHMGVVPGVAGNSVFIAPPHHLSANQEDISKWLNLIEQDLVSVLVSDPSLHELMNLFRDRVSQAGLEEK